MIRPRFATQSKVCERARGRQFGYQFKFQTL